MRHAPSVGCCGYPQWVADDPEPIYAHHRPDLDGLGRAINPHLFRDCAATSIAIDDPGHVGIACRLLGHRAASTTERYYNHARGVEASGLMQKHSLALRWGSPVPDHTIAPR